MSALAYSIPGSIGTSRTRPSGTVRSPAPTGYSRPASASAVHARGHTRSRPASAARRTLAPERRGSPPSWPARARRACAAAAHRSPALPHRPPRRRSPRPAARWLPPDRGRRPDRSPRRRSRPRSTPGSAARSLRGTRAARSPPPPSPDPILNVCGRAQGGAQPWSGERAASGARRLRSLRRAGRRGLRRAGAAPPAAPCPARSPACRAPRARRSAASP